MIKLSEELLNVSQRNPQDITEEIMKLSQNLMMLGVATTVLISLMVMGTNGQNRFIQCCTSVSTKEVTLPITGFRLQKRNPPCVKAVIFFTTDGEKCSHWNQTWVWEKIQNLVKLKGLERMNSTVSTPLSNSTTA